ncbi:MAG TPA: thiamine diphosphokinase [Smithella sp.]|nr:thiamine diphosphokinase [Smithella sp.]
MNKTIFIISGGALADPPTLHNKLKALPRPLIICCDGATRHLLHSGIQPDVIIGDMDSIAGSQLESYRAQGVQIIQYTAEKDFTDTELALDYAMDLKPDIIFIWGAWGGRIDHTLANVFLLSKAQARGIKTYLTDKYCEVFLLDDEAVFKNDQEKTVSLLALTPEVTGVTLTGFLYPLRDGTLRLGESRGMSNIITAPTATISRKSGKLLVITYLTRNGFPEADG